VNLRCPYETTFARCDGKIWHDWTVDATPGRCPPSSPTGTVCSDGTLACTYPETCDAVHASSRVYVCDETTWEWFDPYPVECPAVRPDNGAGCGPCGALYGVCKYDLVCNARFYAHEAKCVDGKWSVTDTPSSSSCPP
jgi:hypothetical protein